MKNYSLIKTIIFNLFVIAFISCSSFKGDTTKIKSIRLTKYLIDNKSVEVKQGAFYSEETYEYDSNFNLIKDRLDTYKYDFDNQGNILKKYSYNNSGDIFQTEIFKSDSAGNTAEILDYDYQMKDVENKTILKYDLLGNLIRQSIYDNNDSLLESCVYEYDNKKIKKMRTIRKYDELYFKYSYQYDYKNRIIEKTTYKNGNKVLRKVLYEYAGNEKKEIIYSLNDEDVLSVDSRKTYEYDNDSNLISETHFNNGNEYKTTYKYSSDGKLSKEISSESEILYSYFNGNKMTKTCFSKNKQQSWKEEEIYNDNGNKIQSIHYDKFNKISSRYFFGYNEKNQLVFDSSINTNGKLLSKNNYFIKNDSMRYKQSVSFIFDLSTDSEFPITAIGNGKGEYTTYQFLDKKGNVIVQITDYISVKQLEYDYTLFDSKGNWTRRLVKEFGEPNLIETREIKYY